MASTTQPQGTSTVLLVVAWFVVVLPTVWGLEHTVESALKLFRAPAPAAAGAPAATKP